MSNKYLAPDSYDENALTEQDASFNWDIIQPTLYADKGYNAQAKTGEYLFCYTKSDGTSVRYLYCNESYFDSWSRDNSKYALYLEPASEMRYYNASSCTELVTMTFDVPADAVLTYADGYPEGYSKEEIESSITDISKKFKLLSIIQQIYKRRKGIFSKKTQKRNNSEIFRRNAGYSLFREKMIY